MRRDLHHPSNESREELLAFTKAELKLDIDSLGDLSNPQVARLLDALARELESRPKMPVNVVRFPGRQDDQVQRIETHAGSIEHLAGEEQLWAIEKLFDYPEVFSKFTISTVTPGQEDKGRGQTITRLHLTEIPFWKGNRKKAYLALKDAAKGGKVTEESTARGVGDEFHTDYQKGKNRLGECYSHFFTWYWNCNYQNQRSALRAARRRLDSRASRR